MRTVVLTEPPAERARRSRGGRRTGRPRPAPRPRRGSRARGRRTAGGWGAAPDRCRARSGRACPWRCARAWKSSAHSAASRTRTSSRQHARSGRAAGRPDPSAEASANEATWPRACTPASVRPAPATATRAPPVSVASASSTVPWTVRPRARGLRLPAREVGPVVGEGERGTRVGSGCAMPGFSGFDPCGAQRARVRRIGRHLQREQARRGHAEVDAPPLRFTRLPTASTRAPAARTTSITSRVEPPVVITSSTTTTPSPGRMREAAAQGHRAVLALGEEGAAAESPRHLVGDDHAAQRGCDHRARRLPEHGAERGRQRAAQARGHHRIHEHARALQVARGVQARGQQEVALQEGAAPSGRVRAAPGSSVDDSSMRGPARRILPR